MSEGLIVYHGGKSRIADKIIRHFPREARCYVEPFFGGGGVYFNVPDELYHVRVINDLNKSLITFFRVLRNRPDDLLRVCELTPYAFDEQRDCRDDREDPEDELETARRVWVRQRQNFAGRQSVTAAGWRRGDSHISAAKAAMNALDRIHDFARRLLTAEINNTDAMVLIADYGRPDTFIYEDPPYMADTRGGDCYLEEMSREDHERLCNVNLKAAEGGALIAISGYDNELYNDKLSGWRKAQFDHITTSISFAKDKSDMKRTETIWMNYPTSLELGDNWDKPVPKASNPRERALLKTLRAKGLSK